jgi:hypothetical protein
MILVKSIACRSSFFIFAVFQNNVNLIQDGAEIVDLKTSLSIMIERYIGISIEV